MSPCRQVIRHTLDQQLRGGLVGRTHGDEPRSALARVVPLLVDQPQPRGLLSSTFRLSVSAFCGAGGAFRGCLGGVQGVLRGLRACFRVYFVSETAEVELKSGRV